MKICIPIQAKAQKEVLKMLKSVVSKADIAEIWLDHIKDLKISELLKNKPLPVLCVCKKPRDKGLFKGTYAEMAEVLIEAVKYGADYIDIPFSMPEKLSKKIVQQVYHSEPQFVIPREDGGDEESHQLSCKQPGSRIKSGMTKEGVGNDKVQVIISHHNFTKTPAIKQMHQLAKDMQKRGADIVKIAVIAKDLDDTFKIISLAQTLKEEGITHILIAMGKKGVLSRVLTPMLGGTMMFAPLKANNASASGQLTVRELREVWSMFQ